MRDKRVRGLSGFCAACEQHLRRLAPSLTCRHAAEIVMLDNYIMVYKYLGDLMFYVTGSQDENELILYTVLQAFYESVSILLRYELQLVGTMSVPGLTQIT
jgi:hypothetical protein